MSGTVNAKGECWWAEVDVGEGFGRSRSQGGCCQSLILPEFSLGLALTAAGFCAHTQLCHQSSSSFPSLSFFLFCCWFSQHRKSGAGNECWHSKDLAQNALIHVCVPGSQSQVHFWFQLPANTSLWRKWMVAPWVLICTDNILEHGLSPDSRLWPHPTPGVGGTWRANQWMNDLWLFPPLSAFQNNKDEHIYILTENNPFLVYFCLASSFHRGMGTHLC